jgi:hypothetical protein
MSKNRTTAWSTNFAFSHEDRYIDKFLWRIYIEASEV